MNEFIETPDEPVELRISLSEMLIDAIVGVGLPTLAIALEAERTFMASFTGSQHNQHWRWEESKLRVLTEEQLQALYYNLKVAQHGS